MKDTHHPNMIRANAIEDDVTVTHHTAQAGADVFAFTPQFGIGNQLCKVSFKLSEIAGSLITAKLISGVIKNVTKVRLGCQ